MVLLKVIKVYVTDQYYIYIPTRTHMSVVPCVPFGITLLTTFGQTSHMIVILEK